MNEKIIIFVLLIYIIVISFIIPVVNKNKLRKHSEDRDLYLSNLSVGDKVVTVSGIYGLIKNVNKNIIYLEISNNVIIEMDREGIMGVIGKTTI